MTTNAVSQLPLNNRAQRELFCFLTPRFKEILLGCPRWLSSIEIRRGFEGNLQNIE